MFDEHAIASSGGRRGIIKGEFLKRRLAYDIHDGVSAKQLKD